MQASPNLSSASFRASERSPSQMLLKTAFFPAVETNVPRRFASAAAPNDDWHCVLPAMTAVAQRARSPFRPSRKVT